jgi:hypothetical protein
MIVIIKFIVNNTRNKTVTIVFSMLYIWTGILYESYKQFFCSFRKISGSQIFINKFSDFEIFHGFFILNYAVKNVIFFPKFFL